MPGVPTRSLRYCPFYSRCGDFDDAQSTLQPAPCTLHRAPCTEHPAASTLHRAPCSQHHGGKPDHCSYRGPFAVDFCAFVFPLFTCGYLDYDLYEQKNNCSHRDSNPRKKGLRERSSPMCTLSQNGYGDSHLLSLHVLCISLSSVLPNKWFACLCLQCRCCF